MEEFDWTGVPPDRRPEIRRRIEILERLLKLTKPEPADREAAQREMGLSRSAFYLLLKRWKDTRRPADLSGANSWRSGPRGERCAVHPSPFPEQIPMDQLDWSKVPEGLRKEVERRINIIEEFLAIPTPDADDRSRLARKLGLSQTMARMLVSSWRHRRDPAAIAGARKPPSRGGRKLPPQVRAIIESVLAGATPEARTADLVRELQRRCQEARIRQPASSTAAALVRQARQQEGLQTRSE